MEQIQPAGWFYRVCKIGETTVKMIIDVPRGLTRIFVLKETPGHVKWVEQTQGVGGSKEREK